MKIGVPKEIKPSEDRIGMTPFHVHTLISQGHTVYIQKSAGIKSGFTDDSYLDSGAYLVDSLAEVYHVADMIVKVKEPIPEEYVHIRREQIIMTFFHFAASKELIDAMLHARAVCIAYETTEDRKGGLPILTPMSIIAGKLSIHHASRFLESVEGGKGKLLGRVTGAHPSKVIVLGCGSVGETATRLAIAMGAEVTVIDLNLGRLEHIQRAFPSQVKTLFSTVLAVSEEIQNADVVIGAVMQKGRRAPTVLTYDHLSIMEKGTVIVDVSIDQGGCFASSHSTTYGNPVYTREGILHCCITNMPSAVPKTATVALSNASFPYISLVASMGWERAISMDHGLSKGLNIANGDIVYGPLKEEVRLLLD